MPTRVLFFLVFLMLGTLLTNSIIIFKEKGTPYDNQQFTISTKTVTTNFDLSSTEKGQETRQSDGMSLQNEFQMIPTNKPDFDVRQEIMGQKIKNLNLNQFQRRVSEIPSHFPDEQDIIYTSELHIFSSLGAESGSKKMAFIKSKIEANRKRIFEHNYSKKKSYMLAENKFIIYTPQEFREMYLTLKEPIDKNYILNQQISVIETNKNIRSLQASPNNSSIVVNWKTAKKMTSVKFQNTCGACYSFTPIGAIESAYMIFKNTTLNLAEQQVVDCSTPYDNYGCIGGWNANTYRYIRDFGILHESDYPYKADFGNCTVPANPFKYSIKNYVELANDCNVVIEALRNQPLSIAVNSEGWMYYSSGVYTDCRVGGSNHGVILAGVDQTSWLIKNSWGFTWGENGYMRIARDAPNNACNVCRWASYPVM